MSFLQRARHLLRLYNFLPKKRLGQNFVVNTDLLQRMISYASITKDDIVLEVGTGLGFLTHLLSRECKRVITVEVDPKLIKILRAQLYGLQNVDLIEGDILTLSVSVPSFNKVVSTPPYSISSPLLFWLLERKFDCAVLTFQKEFAERLAASVGSKEYGRLTVTAYYRGEVELLGSVPRKMFYPPPDVDSMIVRLKPREPPFQVTNEETFLELVQTLFTQRNKKVRNAILLFLHKRGINGGNALELADSLPLHDRRVRELAPEDFGFLANEIVRNPSFGLSKRSINAKS
jgi:16S rRNA (adenine1518-N6/adenine1519-N6)-dimethyltransferase